MSYEVDGTTLVTWGLLHKGLDVREDWRVPLFIRPKLTPKQVERKARLEKKGRKYRRCKPGQLAMKEVKYYKKQEDFIIPITAIHRLCLEIGYEYKEGISFQLQAIRALQEAVEWNLQRMFREANLLAAHATRIPIKTKDMILASWLSRDYGEMSIWGWNSKHVQRPWKKQKDFFGTKIGYLNQDWKVKARKVRAQKAKAAKTS